MSALFVQICYGEIMKKLFTYLFLIFLSFQTFSFSEDVEDLEINGVSIGESLLEYLSKEEIVNEIKSNKPDYNYLNNDFGEVYLRLSSDNYEYMSVFVKPNDKNYIIHYVSGTKVYNDKIQQCYKKQKKIVSEFSELFYNTKKQEGGGKYPWDTTGDSYTKYVQLIFESGNAITITCAKFGKKAKIERNMDDALSVEISLKEVENWLSNY